MHIRPREKSQPVSGFLGWASYVVMVYTFTYLLAFGADLPRYIPLLSYLYPGASINAPTSTPIPTAILCDIFLFVVWGLQHSILARPQIQQAVEKVATKRGERLIYLATSVLVAYLMVSYWQPIPQYYVWDFRGSWFAPLAWLSYAIGVTFTIATLITSIKYDLFSMRSKMTGEKFPQVPADVLPWVYKYTRQPLFFGFALAFWSAPLMTIGRFMFALGWSIYSYIGFVMQEKDLAEKIDGYVFYQRKVSGFVPWPNDYIPIHARGKTRVSSQ